LLPGFLTEPSGKRSVDGSRFAAPVFVRGRMTDAGRVTPTPDDETTMSRKRYANILRLMPAD